MKFYLLESRHYFNENLYCRHGRHDVTSSRVLVVSHNTIIGFEAGNSVLIALVPGHCLPFYFYVTCGHTSFIT